MEKSLQFPFSSSDGYSRYLMMHCTIVGVRSERACYCLLVYSMREIMSSEATSLASLGRDPMPFYSFPCLLGIEL